MKKGKLDILKLVDILLDNQNETDDDKVIHLIEDAISDCIGYNHASNDVVEACFIDVEKNRKIRLSGFKPNKSKEVEELEKAFTKRDLAYLVTMMRYERRA